MCDNASMMSRMRRFCSRNDLKEASTVGTENDIRFIRLIRLFFRGSPRSGKIFLVLLLMIGATIPPVAAVTPQPNSPVELVGTHGKFDFIKIDAARRRLLACHTGNNSLDVIDIADPFKPALIKSIPTGAAQGVVVDEKHGRYFVSASKPPQLVIIDAARLEVTGTMPLPEAADLIAYHSETNRVLVDDDEKPQMWIINPERKQIVQTNTYPGSGMEDFSLDKWQTSILQNIKDTNRLAKSDYVEGKLPGVWSTLPAEKPHGLALMPDGKRALVAGGNGKLVLMSIGENDGGKILASTDIAPHVDEIAYNPASGDVYCASGTGVISVVNVGGTQLGPAQTVPSAPGAHSIAVDPISNSVWIVFAKGDKAYVQGFIVGLR